MQNIGEIICYNKKKIMKKINPTLIIITIILVLGVIGGFWLMQKRNNAISNELDLERKLNTALRASLRTTTNKFGEIVNEKLTLQTTIENLKKLNGQLTEDQKRLLARLKASENEKSIITAALIRTNLIIDSLIHTGTVLIGDSIITFVEKNNADINYVVDIFDVMPIDLDSAPSMLFTNLNIPNDTYIEFFWKDDKKEGYPISFSVTNTNKYMKVHNVESFAIPSLQMDDLDPNSWQKFNKWLDNISGNTGRYVVGALIGFGTAVVILR